MIRILQIFGLCVPLLAAPVQAAPLIEISISPEGRVKVSAGEVRPVLMRGAWTEFEVTIENAARLTTPLTLETKQLMKSEEDAARDRWLKCELVPAGPLSGAALEKRTLRLWSRDAGMRAAVFTANAGQGSQDLGFRSDVLLTFVIRSVEAKPDERVPQ